MAAQDILDRLDWFGHASFRVRSSAVVYLDPWEIPRAGVSAPADLILVTHSHYDHFSRADVEALSGPDTVILASADVAAELGGAARGLAPGETADEKGVRVRATHAYNVGKEFHPPERKWLGFIVDLPQGRLFYPGDTDVIPELTGVKPDVLLMPVGGTYTTDADEAARGAEMVQPQVAVPMHWGKIVGTAEDARRFAKVYPGETRILDLVGAAAGEGT